MNIKISKNSHSCAACETDFTHEQTLTSTVRVLEGALQREDFCATCWAAEKNKNTYSVWKTVYYDPKMEEQEPPEVFSPLRQLFYESAEQESRAEMAKAFLAAGLLRRQKVFRRIKESDESDGEVRVTLYADRIGNRLIEVPDPHFTYVEMDQAGTLLLARLQELEAEASEEDTEKGSCAEPDETKGAQDPPCAADSSTDEVKEEAPNPDEKRLGEYPLDEEGGELSSLDSPVTHLDEEAAHAQA